jgi:hypothetical protein
MHTRGLGRTVFVAILLLIAGTLNVIYGIAAVGDAHFFDNTQADPLRTGPPAKR